jgi:hypothetical protein
VGGAEAAWAVLKVRDSRSMIMRDMGVLRGRREVEVVGWDANGCRAVAATALRLCVSAARGIAGTDLALDVFGTSHLQRYERRHGKRTSFGLPSVLCFSHQFCCQRMFFYIARDSILCGLRT